MTDSTTQRLERLAAAVNSRIPGCRAWVEGPGHFRVDTGPTEVTYQDLPKLTPERKDVALADWTHWAFIRLYYLSKVPHLFHNNDGEPTCRTTDGAYHGKTFAAALLEALYVALNVEGE